MTGLIYITGVGGSGKSSLQKRLEERGYTAVDTDHGYTAFFNKKTGEQTVGPTLEVRTPEWLKAQIWQFIPDKMEELYERSKHELIFVCGTGLNEAEYKHYFKKLFALIIDNDTLMYRLINRPGDHSYGKSEHERELSRLENNESRERYEKLGATFIDANQPIDAIIDEILKIVML